MDARLVRFAVGKKEAFCPWILSVLQRIAAACDLCCWLAGSPAVFHACAAGVDSQRYPERLGFPSVPPACVPVRKRNPLCAPNPLPSSKVAIEPFSLKLFTLSEKTNTRWLPPCWLHGAIPSVTVNCSSSLPPPPAQGPLVPDRPWVLQTSNMYLLLQKSARKESVAKRGWTLRIKASLMQGPGVCVSLCAVQCCGCYQL